VEPAAVPDQRRARNPARNDKTIGFATSDKVEMYPVEAAEPDHVDPAPNSTWDFEVMLFLTGDPQTRAVVA
jgi:hypothetical protein